MPGRGDASVDQFSALARLWLFIFSTNDEIALAKVCPATFVLFGRLKRSSYRNFVPM
jgi:hypothetical protein